MTLTADQIEETVSKLLYLKKTHSVDQINDMPEFDNFRSSNVIFYKMILTDSSFDQSIFKEMMKMKRRLESGEDQYSVDVRFGQFMADRYLTPVVDKLNQ